MQELGNCLYDLLCSAMFTSHLRKKRENQYEKNVVSKLSHIKSYEVIHSELKRKITEPHDKHQIS